MGPLILSRHPAKFGSMEVEIMAFVISVPIAVAIPFSMSRFTNGLIIPILYNKTLITNVRLWSLRHYNTHSVL